MKDISQEVKPSEILLFERGFIYIGFILAILNLVMGMSYQIFGIYHRLGVHKMDPGALIGTTFYALFVIYWQFWFVPFFASIGINIYGGWKKRRLSVIGIILSLVGILALMISYATLGGQLPD